MKLSLALGRPPLSRQMAWGCLTTNLAFPGFGSLLAGRKVGYCQVPFTIVGFGLTMIAGVPAIMWSFSNWSRMMQGEDSMENLQDMWVHFRWPMLGMGFFLIGLLWSLMTSFSILAEVRANHAMRPLPPKLNR